MKYRKLRIAWSVGWGILCLLLIVLWVRSYWRTDSVQIPCWHKYFFVISGEGLLYANPTFNSAQEPGFSVTTKPIKIPLLFVNDRSRYRDCYWVRSVTWLGTTMIYVPYWIPAVVLAAVGTISWMIPSRFSLRTLLIGMTVFAVALGLIFALKR